MLYPKEQEHYLKYLKLDLLFSLLSLEFYHNQTSISKIFVLE